MIIKTAKETLFGYQAIVKAALVSGCRSYFSSPSPFEALLLSEGLKRFHESHGVCVQAESPEAAVSMALGAASLGKVPLISGTFEDYLNTQSLLTYFLQSDLPCVYVVLLQNSHPPFYPLFRALLQQVQPCGFGLQSFYPSSIESIYDLTQEAFQCAQTYQAPVLLFVDQSVFHSMGLMRPAPARSASKLITGVASPKSPEETFHYLNKKNEEQLKHELLNRSFPVDPEFLFLSLGGIGAQSLLHIEKGLGMVPETLWPFPSTAIKDLITEHSDLPLYIFEPFGSGLTDALYAQGIKGETVILSPALRSYAEQIHFLKETLYGRDV